MGIILLMTTGLFVLAMIGDSASPLTMKPSICLGLLICVQKNILTGKDMNYYVQGGGAAKAGKIKAAFERLGYDVKAWSFTSGIYYTLNGKIVNTNFGSNEYELVLNNPDYKELPVEPVFKVGDWLFHNTLGVLPILVEDYSELQGYKVVCKSAPYCLQKGVVESEYHLWTVADAKDGDTLVSPDGSIIIYAGKIADNGLLYYHVALNKYKNLRTHEQISVSWLGQETAKPATREQRDMLFAKMKEEGYEWDAEKKKLKKIPKHYDISNFQAGMPVLVREYDTCVWQWVLYSHFNGVGLFFAAGKTWRQCIPFNEDTKHLLGATDMCPEEYINWVI